MVFFRPMQVCQSSVLLCKESVFTFTIFEAGCFLKHNQHISLRGLSLPIYWRELILCFKSDWLFTWVAQRHKRKWITPAWLLCRCSSKSSIIYGMPLHLQLSFWLLAGFQWSIDSILWVKCCFPVCLLHGLRFQYNWRFIISTWPRDISLSNSENITSLRWLSTKRHLTSVVRNHFGFVTQNLCLRIVFTWTHFDCVGFIVDSTPFVGVKPFACVSCGFIHFIYNKRLL